MKCNNHKTKLHPEPVLGGSDWVEHGGGRPLPPSPSAHHVPPSPYQVVHAVRYVAGQGHVQHHKGQVWDGGVHEGEAPAVVRHPVFQVDPAPHVMHRFVGSNLQRGICYLPKR